LDRIHNYIAGWEVQKLRNELFTDKNGFIVDYLAEVLKILRKDDFSNHCTKFFELSASINTRDRTGVLKTFSGLCKIIYPHGEFTEEQAKEILDFALEGRKRVKNQLILMDETFNAVEFSYTVISSGKKYEIKTLEEKEFPSLVRTTYQEKIGATAKEKTVPEEVDTPEEEELLSGKHIVFEENQKGISYEKLFASYLKGATEIKVTDPYIRMMYQTLNLFEFIQMLIQNKEVGDDIMVHLVTKYDDFKEQECTERLDSLVANLDGSGIIFSYEFDQTASFHARNIETDTGWKISIDRGLDIFQPYDFKNPFNLANRLQEERQTKSFEVTYLKK
jgi:ATP-dependent Lon protease